MHKLIVSAIDELSNKNIPFVLLYGAGMVHETLQLNNLQHLVHYSGDPNGKFGEYIEHFYVSNDIHLDNLPAKFVFYNEIINKNCEEAINYIKAKAPQEPINLPRAKL